MKVALLAAIGFGLIAGLAGQERREPPVFKVELTIKDGTEGAAKTGRRYTLLMNNGEKGTLRSGNRLPITAANGSTTYVDVGVNIDATVREQNGIFPLRAEIEVSSAGKPEAMQQPVISQMRIMVNTTVLLGKLTQVAAVDDPVTQRKLEVDALVTKVN
ncbi:MAG: hypothetical protein IPP47_21765 [Bryobacterales bacterium]|nr:hypothetical protein [Bryobacterales bacterium]